MHRVGSPIGTKLAGLFATPATAAIAASALPADLVPVGWSGMLRMTIQIGVPVGAVDLIPTQDVVEAIAPETLAGRAARKGSQQPRRRAKHSEQ